MESEKFHVIYNFAPTSDPVFVPRDQIRGALDIPADALMVLGVGFADLRKGIDLFISTAKEAVGLLQTADIYFVWLGTAPDSESIKWLKHDLEKTDLLKRVRFVSSSVTPQDYYAAADIFFLSSREDPFPNVVLEAMSHGLPVVVFDGSGGAAEAIDSDSGRMVPYLDVGAAAKAIVELCQDGVLRQNLGRAARERIQCGFGKKEFKSRWLELIAQYCGFHPKKTLSVSVVVPSYNHAKFLAERLDSIDAQSCKPMEIIFVDDASTDESVEFARDWRGRSSIPMTIIRHQENSGSAFLAWKDGIRVAKGDLIWIAESDDRSDPEFLESLMPAFYDSAVALAYTQSRVIGLNGEIFADDYADYTESLSRQKWQMSYIADGRQEIEEALSQINTIPNASAVVVRRQVALSALEGLERFKLAGDWLYYVRCLQRGSLKFVARSLNDHRRGPTTKTFEVERELQAVKEEIEVRLSAAQLFSISHNRFNRAVAQTIFSYLERSARFQIERLPFSANPELCSDITKIRAALDERRHLPGAPNVLTIIPDLTVGGGQISAIRLANAFCEVANSYLLNARSSLVDEGLFQLIDSKVQWIEGELGETPWSGHVGHDSWRVDQDARIEVLAELVKLHKIDVIISHVWWSDRLAYELHRRCGVKWFIRMHGCYELNMRRPEADPGFAGLVRPMFAACSGVLPCSDKNLQIFRDWNIPEPALIRQLENPVQIDADSQPEIQLARTKNEVLFCISSRAIEEKGWAEAIMAIQLINGSDVRARNFKSAVLVLIGDGEYAEALKVKYAGETAIRFLGRLVRPISVIRQCDVALLPTYFGSESRPMFLAEALSVGLPCVATDIGAIREMLECDGKMAGIILSLSPHGRVSVDELANAMRALMESADRDEAKSVAQQISETRLDGDTVRDDYCRALGIFK